MRNASHTLRTGWSRTILQFCHVSVNITLLRLFALNYVFWCLSDNILSYINNTLLRNKNLTIHCKERKIRFYWGNQIHNAMYCDNATCTVYNVRTRSSIPNVWTDILNCREFFILENSVHWWTSAKIFWLF